MTAISFKTYNVPTTFVYALIPAAVALNVVGSFINHTLKLPMFLDMIGTAVVASTIGPWWGVLAGIMTNTTLGFLTGPISLPFASTISAMIVYGLKGEPVGKWWPAPVFWMVSSMGVSWPR